ncbi:hypothetical protein ACFOOK_11305 [Micromonospora krabiensis]|uniref:Uncharacterized protein n=1 Tax=Micromonospora krabiensis TaxID=307121 RepID=A0A1C3NA23_9ACTN|nr:hypothetical protein GA0070620_4992 [Micromonospora krabiensis]
MPVSALDQHLKGNCRPSAHPGTALPDRGAPARAEFASCRSARSIVHGTGAAR